MPVSRASSRVKPGVVAPARRPSAGTASTESDMRRDSSDALATPALRSAATPRGGSGGLVGLAEPAADCAHPRDAVVALRQIGLLLDNEPAVGVDDGEAVADTLSVGDHRSRRDPARRCRPCPRTTGAGRPKPRT